MSDIGTKIKLPSVLLWDSWSNLNVTYNKANLYSHSTVYSQIKTVWKNYFSIIKGKQKKNNELWRLYTVLSQPNWRDTCNWHVLESNSSACLRSILPPLGLFPRDRLVKKKIWITPLTLFLLKAGGVESLRKLWKGVQAYRVSVKSHFPLRSPQQDICYESKWSWFGGALFSGEEVSGRGQRGQTPGDVGQERKVGQALDVGLELLSYLGHPGQFLLVLLQETEQHGMTSNHLEYLVWPQGFSNVLTTIKTRIWRYQRSTVSQRFHTKLQGIL